MLLGACVGIGRAACGYWSCAYACGPTGSSHSFAQPALGISIARWESQLLNAAPLQCFALAGMFTTSPRRNARWTAPLLISTASRHAEQQLAATLVSAMHAPMIAAPWFERHIMDGNLIGAHRRQVTLTVK